MRGMDDVELVLISEERESRALTRGALWTCFGDARGKGIGVLEHFDVGKRVRGSRRSEGESGFFNRMESKEKKDDSRTSVRRDAWTVALRYAPERGTEKTYTLWTERGTEKTYNSGLK